MNDIFKPYLRKFILVFFDDILVYSKTWEDHLSHLHQTLDVLQNHQLAVKKSKCSFGQSQVEYLGHIVSRDGVAADPTKIQAIIDWPIPKNVKELRGFLGLSGYYRKFIPGYGKVCQPLYQLTKKDGFIWSPEATAAFQELKRTMTSPQLLALPNFSIPFTLECDSSGNGIEAVLQQNGRPIAFTRRHFIIKTDHSSLKYFLSQRTNTPFQQKWVAKLLGFDYEIQYRQGHDNIVADALSRVVGSSQLQEEPLSDFLECKAITYPYFGWLDELRIGLEQDSWIQSKVNEVLAYSQAAAIDPNLSKYHVDNGFLKYKGRIVLSPDSSWKRKVFEEHHSSPSSGHEGVLKTYQRLKRGFYWVGIKKDLRSWVAECRECQQNKYETISPPGLLQPLPIPTHVWKDISMDFITGLPLCKSKSVILVIVDRLSKYAHFIPLAHPYTASMVAQEFVDNVFKLHGMPSTISDGQTEVVNRCLETYLRCFTSCQPKKWLHWLPWAE
ncbi:hypothetical protein TB1_036363 [Malus domestica]